MLAACRGLQKQVSHWLGSLLSLSLGLVVSLSLCLSIFLSLSVSLCLSLLLHSRIFVALIPRRSLQRMRANSSWPSG